MLMQMARPIKIIITNFSIRGIDSKRANISVPKTAFRLLK